MNSRIKSILQSASLLTVIGSGLRIAGGILTLPLALRLVPKAEMGLYYTFLSIGALVSLLDFGFAPAVNRNAAYAMGGAKEFAAKGVPALGHGGPNLKLLGLLVNATGVYYKWCSLLLALVLGLGGTSYIYTVIKAGGLNTSLVGAWILFSCAQVGVFYGSYWMNLLMGVGEVKICANVAIGAQVVALVVLITGLLLGLALWSYGISAMAGALITMYQARKKFLAIHPSRNQAPTPGEIKKVVYALWPMAWRQGVVMLGAFLIQRGNTIICSSRIGLDATAEYGLTITLIAIVIQLSVVPLNVAMPEITRLRVGGNKTAIWSLFSKRLYLGLLAGGVLIAVLVLCGNDFLKILGSKTQFLGTGLFTLLGVIWMFEAHHSQYATLVLSENENPFIVPALLSGIIIALTAWWAAGKWGLWGLVLSQGIIQLLWNNWWTVLRGMHSLKSK